MKKIVNSKKMKTGSFIFIFIILSSLLYGFGSYEESLSLTTANTITVNHSLDSFFSVESQVTITQDLIHSGSRGAIVSPTTSIVVFSAGNSNDCLNRTAISTLGYAIDYNIYLTDSNTNHTPLKDASTYQSSPDGMVYDFPADYITSNQSSNVTISYTLEIPEDQFVPVGIYTDTIDADLYKNNFSSSPEDSESILISITVEPSVNISIVDVGAGYNASATSYSMDFGSLSEGEFLEADAVARANTTYSISIYSYNGSRMKHETVDEYVPYTLSVDNNSVNITTPMSPVNAVTNAPLTPSTGTAHLIKVIIDSYGWVPSGDYEDNLVLEILGN